MHQIKNESDNINEFFAIQNVDAKYIAARIIRLLVREVNKHKLDYGSLRYIYRRVREKTDLVKPQKPKKLYQLPKREEIEKFFSVIDDPIHKLMFEFLIGTGVREAELCNIDVNKINFQNNTIFITGKGKKDRLILISDSLKAKLQIYLSNRNNRYLFESNRGTKFSTRRIQQLCAHYKFRSNLEDIPLTPHTFRHLYNTRLAEAGVSKETRALLSGHSNQATQDIYTHLSVGGAIAVDILEKLSKLGL